MRCDGNRVFDARGHSALVDVAHRKEIVAKAELFDLRPFAGIDIAGADVGEVFGVELWRVAAQIDEFVVAVAKYRRERHAVDVARRRSLGRIDVRVGVKPDEADLGSLLFVMIRYRRKRRDRDGVVAAEDDREFIVAEHLGELLDDIRARGEHFGEMLRVAGDRSIRPADDPQRRRDR